ncbi:50S ribosomal protein L19 [Candidatus Dojkabacteria bacterium]|uniref:Large ribosomal subunit protein bL19 n=1 Tax=Candidatus Dojkabacteria bacterium TaxID=2099670 RepID=A0A3M0Z2Z0_9BACT|nr:MAG: 50S ribosomal protein L19 [Candidatus Dojkabacteria bacterium]
MDSELFKKVSSKMISNKVLPSIKVGQTVRVETITKDGDKTRIQQFTGLVIAVKGSGINKTFTVRKVSDGYGVEKIFPFYSPIVKSIKIIKEEKVRRSKLYFMRDRVGKSAMRVRKGRTKVFNEQLNIVSATSSQASDQAVEDASQ